MNRRIRDRSSSFRAFLGGVTLVATGGLAAGCARYLDVEVALVEPCDQRNQALNGINSFQITADVGGGTEAVVTRHTANEAAPPIEAPIGTGTIITVEGWTADGTTDNAVFNTAPQAIGRSVPLSLNEDAPDKIVLLTGRRDSIGALANAEGTCQELKNGEQVPGRHGHTATFVPGTSLVFIAGGAVWIDEPGQPGVRSESFLNSAEIWDSVTGEITELPPLPNARAYHSATALPDGTVLLIGGRSIVSGALSVLTSGIIFDPNNIGSDEPYRTVIFRQARVHHTATLLEESGLVVIVGGCNGPGCGSDSVFEAGGDPTVLQTSVEVYSIADQNSIPGEPLLEPRAMHSASAIGRQVVVSGGVRPSGILCNLEVFSANGDSVTSLALGQLGNITPCRARHDQVTLQTGSGPSRIAIIGGYVEAENGRPSGTPTAAITYWNTGSGTEATAGSLISGRAGHQVALMQDGSIFVYGGNYAAGGAPAEKLLLQLNNQYQASALALPPVTATERAAIAPLPSNQVFISGGFSSSTRVTSAAASLYFGE